MMPYIKLVFFKLWVANCMPNIFNVLETLNKHCFNAKIATKKVCMSSVRKKIFGHLHVKAKTIWRPISDSSLSFLVVKNKIQIFSCRNFNVILKLMMYYALSSPVQNHPVRITMPTPGGPDISAEGNANAKGSNVHARGTSQATETKCQCRRRQCQCQGG